jgi:hypothetical protein
MALIRVLLLYLCAFLAATPLTAATPWAEHQRIQQGDYGSIDVGGFDLNIAGQVHAITYNGNITDAINDNGEMAETFVPDLWQAFNPDTVTTYGLTNEYFYDEQVALNPAFKALMVMVITQGLGAGGLGILQSTQGLTGMAAFQTAASNAFITNLAVGTMEGAITGNFDLGDILKNAGTSALTAGLTAGLTTSFNINGLPTEAIFDGFSDVSISSIVNGGLDNLIEAGVSTLINGGDFGDTFWQLALTDSVNVLQAALQNQIGGIFENGSNGGEGSFGHVFLHGLVGCATAELLDGHCAAGAAGGAISALYAGTLGGTTLTDEQQQNNAQLLGAFAGYLLSGSDANNVNLAGSIAQSAMANNRLLHRDEIEWAEEFDEELAAELGISVEEARALIIAELLWRVSDDGRRMADERNTQVADFIDANAPQGLVVDGQNLFAELDRSSDEFKNSTLNLETIYSSPEYYSAVQNPSLLDSRTILMGAALREDAHFFNQLSREDALELFTQATALRDALIVAQHADLMSGNADPDFQSQMHAQIDFLSAGLQQAAITSNHFSVWERFSGTDEELQALYGANMENLLAAYGGVEGLTALGLARSAAALNLRGVNPNDVVPDVPPGIPYFRVQGGQGPRAGQVSQERLSVNHDGTVSINPGCNGQLCVSVGGPEHAAYYLSNSRPDGTVIVFEVDLATHNIITEASVQQFGNKGAGVKVTDKSTPGLSLELDDFYADLVASGSSNGRVLTQQEFLDEFGSN